MSHSALLIIDVQRGAFDGVRIAPIDHADELVAGVGKLLNAARAGGVPIVFVQHCDVPGEVFEEDSPQFGLHDSLVPEPGDILIRKRESSAFDGTDLQAKLRKAQIQNVVVCGLQSEHCVSNTTKGALQRGLAVRLAHDGHGTWPWNGESAAAIKSRINAELGLAGAELLSTDQLAAALAMQAE